MKVWKFLSICSVVLGLSVAVFAQSAADDALSTEVDDVVRAQMHEQKIPGVSLAVIRDGKIIKAAGYGLANVELNVPMAPQMVFHSGSLAKAFTATAVMMLVEEGKIGLDDKISKYLPDAPTLWDEVTIRRLLTHTSGIRDYFGEDGDPKYDFHHDFTEDELVRKFAAQTMRFAPGEKWSYCNAGYIILGVVIHRVTGKFWFDFVKEQIFDPLGMTSTRLISAYDIIPDRVSGYQMVNGQMKNDECLAPSWYTTPDGSLYINIFDMAKWDAALDTEKLIKRSTLEQMWTPVKLNDGTTYPYGFAWRISDVNGHRRITHDGVDFAFTNRFARYLNDRLSVIVLINLGEDEEAAMPTRMADNVAAIYIPSLSDGKSRTSAADASKSTPGVRNAQPLSPKQAEVWKGEENLQMYEQQKDLKRFLSIWDEHFVGWPDYDQRPAYKPEFETSAAEEFKEPGTTSPPLPPLKPLAVGLFGDVAVTHYFWPEADQSSPTVFRITHTWQKGPAGWHIIGGMSCEVPRSAEATSSTAASGHSSKSSVATATVPPAQELTFTPAPHSVEAEVLEIDRAWGQAYVKGEIDVIDRTLAPDWRGWLDTIGSDKATELAEFKTGQNRSMENIIDNARGRVYADTVVVEARERVPFRDETGEHWLTWHITDVFAEQGGQWQVVDSHGSTIPNP